MIEDVELLNIKCFPLERISLRGLNILTGINGAGKSTIIQSLLLAAQHDLSDAIDLNGALVDIGEYSDLQYEGAADDSLEIAITTSAGKCAWRLPKENISPDGKQLPSKIPLVSGNVESVHLLTKNMVYLSAERWGPRTNVPLNPQNINPYWLGRYGEFTIQFLHSLSTSTLRDEEGTSISNTFPDDPRIHESCAGTVILPNIIAWMGEVAPNVGIDASVIRDAEIGYSSFSFSKSKKYKAKNVGFGLSYVLGVVTALVSARKGSLVIVENPEAHLHPRGQSKLGQLMALTAKAGVQVVIETHSEHVVNGARIMVRKGAVNSDLLNVLFVARNENKGSSEINALKVNEVGQINEWPTGFFDQQALDMKTLITGN